MTSDEATSNRSPIDTALDLAVFAPLGFALEFRRVVPELAEAGRRQIAFSQSLGKAALKTMARAAGTQGGSPDKPAPRANTSSAAPASAEARPDEADASIAGYDDLTAREVIDRIAAATAAQLRWMASHEASTKRRKTVLAALERALV